MVSYTAPERYNAPRPAEAPPLRLAVAADLRIGGQRFEAAFISGRPTLKAAWINDHDAVDFTGLFAPLIRPFDPDFVSDFGEWRLPLKKVRLGYDFKTRYLSLDIIFDASTSLTLSSGLVGQRRDFGAEVAFDAFFRFNQLPVVSRMVQDDDGLGIKKFSLSRTDGIKLGVDFFLKIRGETHELKFGEPPAPAGASMDGTALVSRSAAGRIPRAEASGGEVKWVEVNKSLGPLYFQRLGFAAELAEGRIKIYVNASFTLAILTLEFYGLYLVVPLPGRGSFEFGLSGLTVTLERPPVTISGGLYKDPVETLYNGQLLLRFGEFSLTALGSYGEMAGGETSLFIFLMIKYPLGGPPFFFVTGLAAGFGLNRRLKMPELKDVPRFPFVAAAMKPPGGPGRPAPRSGGVSPDSRPAMALDQLSDWVRPSSGDYFVSVGVAFTSFNLVRCFALLTVEFGARMQISLLGQAEISLPPNLEKDQHPIAFAQLAIRVAFNADDGYLMAMITLTAESYILDKNCRLTGGAAFCVWFKGPYAGDFVVTLGGCRHPGFKNAHYPEVDPIGVNWAITKELKLKAEAYFALTPNCLMAGGNLEIVFTSGGLRAWFIARAAFYMRWKPFVYDLSIGVSIGASYTFNVLGISGTLKVELGAAVHIFGPPFSGSVTIDLCIFSFTISFGDDKPAPPLLSWDEFDRSFLPQNPKEHTGLVAEDPKARRLCDVIVVDGLLRDVKDSRLIVSARSLSLATISEMPLTAFVFNGRELTNLAYDRGLGVPAMGLTRYEAVHTVDIRRVDAPGAVLADDLFQLEARRENLSPAMWNPAPPGLNDPLLPGVPKGLNMRLKAPDVDEDGMLPRGGGAYDPENLAECEVVRDSGFAFTDWPRPANTVGRGEVFEVFGRVMPQHRKRDDLLPRLARLFGTAGQAHFGDIGRNPGDYFLAEPRLVSTGAQG